MDELIVSLRERMKRKWGNTVQNGYKSGGLHLKKVPPLKTRKKRKTVKVKKDSI